MFVHYIVEIYNEHFLNLSLFPLRRLSLFVVHSRSVDSALDGTKLIINIYDLLMIKTQFLFFEYLFHY